MDLTSGAILLGYAFAGLGYLIGLLLLSSPYTSKSMKVKGNEMMEYSIVCSFYLAFSSIIYGLSGMAYNFISSSLGGNLIGGGTVLGVADYYYEKFIEQLEGYLGVLAIPAALSFIPLVGAVISLVFLVALAPFVLLFSLTISTYFTIAIIFYIFAYLTPIFFSIGSALIPTPLKFGKKIGGLLIASSLVFSAFAPAIPTIADIISKNAIAMKIGHEIEKATSNIFETIKFFIRKSSIMELSYEFILNPSYAFAIGTLLSMLFLVVAIEGLSEAIGGAGEKIVEV